MNIWDEIEEGLNATVDQDLGTVVGVLDGKGMFDEASALELCRLRYEAVSDNWTPQIVRGILEADPLFLESVTPAIIAEAEAVLAAILGDAYTWSGLRVVPRRVPATWREGRAAARLVDVGPNNQASYRTLPETIPSRHRLRFASEEEVRVFDAFERAQQRRPPEATLGIIPGSGFRALAKTFWPDLLITHRGRVAGVEVDGPHHHSRAAADQSRDRLLEDAGVLFIERLVVEDTTAAATLDLFAERFLNRLLAR